MLILSDLHRREFGSEKAQYLIDLLQFPDEAQTHTRLFCQVGLRQRVLPAHLLYVFR